MKPIADFSTKQTFLAILGAYFVPAIFIAVFCFLTGQGEPVSIGKVFLYAGVIISGLGLVALTQAGGDRWSGYGASQFMKNPDYRRKSIEADKPFRKVVSMIVISGAMLAGTGYFLISYFA